MARKPHHRKGMVTEWQQTHNRIQWQFNLNKLQISTIFYFTKKEIQLEQNIRFCKQNCNRHWKEKQTHFLFTYNFFSSVCKTISSKTEVNVNGVILSWINSSKVLPNCIATTKYINFSKCEQNKDSSYHMACQNN